MSLTSPAALWTETSLPGEITFYRLRSTAEAKLRAYITQGEVVPVATRSFGGIGVFAIPEMGRFYIAFNQPKDMRYPTKNPFA